MELVFGAIDFSALAALQNNAEISGLKPLLFRLSIGFILYFMLAVIAWSFSKNLIYNQIFSRKWSAGFFYKFLLLNLCAFTILILFMWIIVNLFNPSIVGAISIFVFFIFGYYMTFLYIFYTKERKIRDSLKKALSFAFTKMYILVPLLFLGILSIMFLLSVVSYLLSFFNTGGSYTPFFISFITSVIFLMGMAWLRFYIVALANKLSK